MLLAYDVQAGVIMRMALEPHIGMLCISCLSGMADGLRLIAQGRWIFLDYEVAIGKQFNINVVCANIGFGVIH